jgi:outer membrane protein OmpA-like peptidoglycan-associated protein
MKNLLILIIIIFGLGTNLIAQEKSRKEIKGDKYYHLYSFDRAIRAYSHTKHLTLQGQRNLAQSYHNMDRNVEAEVIHQQITNAPAGVVAEDFYHYAMVLRNNGKYTEANRMMDKFASLSPNDLRAKDYLANKGILHNLMQDMGKYTVKNQNINSDAIDFGTSFYQDKIVFASSRSKAKMIVRNYNWTGKPYYNLYVAEIKDGQLGKPSLLSKELKGKLHDGPASFSRDGKTMAFTTNNYGYDKKAKVVQLQINFSTLVDDEWSPPTTFSFNSETYSVGHPCLTDNGNTMYFVSDMPGGFGGADIYRISRSSTNTWGAAENLGSTINTEGNEMFPFLDEKQGVLYFSSDGRFGLGGLDIFSCTMDDYGIGPVANAGAPLNTQYDDFALIVDGATNKGYFSSNRPGGSGGDDIYAVVLLDEVPEKVEEIVKEEEQEVAVLDLNFLVNAPENIPVERRVREYFPLRNYVFFEKGSTKLSDRYVKLKKNQVKDFKEDQLEVFTPLTIAGRSSRQMVVYYNVLNILGDRMSKNPSSNVRLFGSSGEGQEHGLQMAESVKAYLVDVFGIEPARITTGGRIQPKLPSEQVGGVSELVLLREEDERVSIESDAPGLLMEFLSGPGAPLKPVELVVVQEAPLDSYVTFNVIEGNESITSWRLEITDDQGITQKFGPYDQDLVGIPGKSILGTRQNGVYKVKMIGQTQNGIAVTRDTTVQMVLWKPSVQTEAMRFSIIYEFDDNQAIIKYQKYLTEVLAPRIPNGATVKIYGYTDVIGDETYNQKLSLERANNVKTILQSALKNAGRNDVILDVKGFGEALNLAQFSNDSPEGRFYNRTVIIDVIPKN